MSTNTIAQNEQSTESTQVEQSTESIQVEQKAQKPRQYKSYGPYSERFLNNSVKVSSDKNLYLKDRWVSTASLYDVALTILARIEYLEDPHNSSLTRNYCFLQGFKNLTVNYEIEGKYKKSIISIKEIAEKILEIAETYRNQEFSRILYKNFVSTSVNKPFKKSNGTSEFKPDQFKFFLNESNVSLMQSDIVLLVKALRLYLTQVVIMIFNSSNPKKWIPEEATYKNQGFAEYSDFVKKILNQCKIILTLSENIDEVRKVKRDAEKAAKNEMTEKREQKYSQKLLEKNFAVANNSKTKPAKKVIELTPEEISTGLFKKKLTKPVKFIKFSSDESNESNESNKSNKSADQSAQSVKSSEQTNLWKTSDKSLVDRLIETGIVPASHVTQKPEPVVELEPVAETEPVVDQVAKTKASSKTNKKSGAVVKRRKNTPTTTNAKEQIETTANTKEQVETTAEVDDKNWIVNSKKNKKNNKQSKTSSSTGPADTKNQKSEPNFKRRYLL